MDVSRVAVLVVLTAVVAPAQTPPTAPAAALLSRLTGAWTGTGTILGQAATVEMEWAPVLAGSYVRLTFASHIGPPPQTQHFEGHAYYQARPDGRLRATWFDSSGLTRPIDATAEASALVAVWGTPETEIGETTYRFVSERELQVIDRVRGKDGTWREFGRSKLSRTLAPR